MDHFHIALSEDQLRAVSSIGLAHVGDAVYELLVRTWLCAHGKATGKDLHRAAIALVCAPEQARRAQRILPLLTAEEETVFKRGRNAAVHAIPKNATTVVFRGRDSRKLMTLKKSPSRSVTTSTSLGLP